MEGADDNGSGVAAVLACLRLLAAAVASGAWRPDHTLIFAFFGAEEQGSIGSHRYLHNCAVERRNPLLDCKFTDAIPRHVVRDKLPSCSGQLADAWRFDKSSFRGALILDQIGYRPPASAAQSRLPVLIEAEAAVRLFNVEELKSQKIRSRPQPAAGPRKFGLRRFHNA